ncbi:LysR family transcriptional regulator [Anaeromassilibacillus sp. SJQ-5]
MNLRQLEVFRAVCEQGGFTRAAQSLYMTQPAVSHVIAELEKEAGCPLFDRISRRIYLTEAGRIFLEKARQILELHEELSAGFPALTGQAPLRIGSGITIANFHLPTILRRCRRLDGFPSVRVTVDQAGRIEEALLNSELDVALIEGVVRHPHLIRQPFSSYDMAAFCAPSHPLATRSPLSLDDLLTAELLLREPGSAIRDAFDSALLLRDRCAEPAWTSVNSPALAAAAREGLGVAVLPACLTEADVAAGRLVRLEVEGLTLRNQNQLVVHRDKTITPPLRLFMEAVTAEEG